MNYNFIDIEECNMCKANAAEQIVFGRRLNLSQGKSPSGKKGISTTVVKCKVCGLIFTNPMPVPQSISQHYGTPPESYWKPSYFVLDSNYFNSQISQYKKLAEIKSGMKSLDIGAGLGKVMSALKNAGFDSYGFEPSLPFYERAISKMNIQKEKLQLASVETANYESNFFDFITFGAVLEHLYDPSGSIQKALSWLKPGGIIHIEVPSANWLINKIANFYYKLICTDYVSNLSPMHSPFHLYEFHLGSFIKNSKFHHYEILFYRYWVANTYMPFLLRKPLAFLMDITNSGMQLEIWLRKTEIANKPSS